MVTNGSAAGGDGAATLRTGEPVGRLHGAPGPRFDLERALKARLPHPTNEARHERLLETELRGEGAHRLDPAGLHPRHKRTHEAIFCHTAESVKRQPAPERSMSRNAARVPKTPEDLEAEARIRGHLRQQMAERGITQTELARRIGRDNGDIVRLLDGSRGIRSLGLVLRICRALKITPTRLLEENADPQYRDKAAD